MIIDASEQIEKFKEFFDSNYIDDLHNLSKSGNVSLLVDFSALNKEDPDLADQLLDEPEETLKAAEISLQQFDIEEIENVKVRFFNLPTSQRLRIRDIRSEHIGKFIFLEGVVKQSTDVRPQVTAAKFECPACGNTISIIQVDIKFKEPTRCSCGRRGRFRLISKELVDAQKLVVEESPEFLTGGEQPKRLSIFLRGDLVEPLMEKKTTPGSKVRIIGVVGEIPILLKTGVVSTRYDLMMECNFIEPLEETFDDVALSKVDIKEIKKLANDPKVYERLVSSMAPSIFGHEDIKGALILQLVGGVKKERKDGSVTRGDMHILLVGDPGAAKSSMLLYVSKAAPRARYVAGRGVSGAGLTAAVVKDEFLKGWALEAGALVLANNGFCMIDEMDKMDESDTSALHEAMAQQQISISKANIQATLKAETTILAAANPKLGRFDPYQPIANQINLPPALINRFDLIFPVRDLPNEKMDTKIASHVLTLQQREEGIEPEVSAELLKKYISYVRKHSKPKLTDGAIDEIKTFYVKLRNTGGTGEEGIKPIPISARQLESLVRLSEASAKIRLSTKVTRLDARKGIALLTRCLKAVGVDPETGEFDIDMMSTGMATSSRNKIIVVRDIIDKFTSEGKKTIPIEDITVEASERHVTESKVEEVIDQLKKEGAIFEPKRGFIQKI